jgi:hypothetical protein
MVDDDHGDERNITMNDLRQAAEAAGITPEEAVKNVQNSVNMAGKSGKGGS